MREERTPGPRQPAAAPHPPRTDPSARKTPPGALAAAAGAVVLLAAAVAWAGARYAGPATGVAPPPAPAAAAPSSLPGGAGPAPTATCAGVSCAALEPAATACANDAATALVGHDYGIRIELRYSARCRAAWAKMSGTTAGDRVMVTPEQGAAQEYRQQYGHDAHTKMVPALSPGDARACALVDGRGTVCATEPPTAPASLPPPTAGSS
ncbi:DUF2690 domain-containing protein [Streptomyces sp. NPDC004244]